MPSKKEVQKIQKRVVDDKTFGLKNKNKSKVVQSFVETVTLNAKRAGLTKDEAVRLEKMKAEREQTKAEKKAREAEMMMLFQPALTKKQKEEKAAKEAAAKAAADKAKADAEGPEIIDARTSSLWLCMCFPLYFLYSSVCACSDRHSSLFLNRASIRRGQAW